MSSASTDTVVRVTYSGDGMHAFLLSMYVGVKLGGGYVHAQL